MEEEIWKPIKGYEGYYKVSSFGRVKSLPRKGVKGGIRKPSITSDGYLRLSLSKSSKRKRYSVHRLVASAFIKNKENKPAVNHKNGDKKYNWVKNLEWCTNRENSTHAVNVTKVVPRGEQHPRTNLSNKDVVEIRKLLEGDRFMMEKIASMYKTTPSVISSIHHAKSWRSLLTSKDTVISRRYAKGDMHPSSTLTSVKVKEIIHLLRTTRLTHQNIAEKYGVTQATITRVNLGQCWRHLNSEHGIRTCETRGHIKLSEKDVVEIIGLLQSTNLTIAEITKRYKVKSRAISAINLGETWRKYTKGKVIRKNKRRIYVN